MEVGQLLTTGLVHVSVRWQRRLLQFQPQIEAYGTWLPFAIRVKCTASDLVSDFVM